MVRLGELPGILRDIHTGGEGISLFPIGTQGSGKTTVGRFLKAVLGCDLLLLSADGVRLELFRQAFPDENVDYERVWVFCRNREGRVARLLHERLEKATETFVYLDRMNLTQPSRKPYLLAERINVALDLHLSLKDAVMRNREREENKYISDEIVAAMFAVRVPPVPGEFDHVLKVDLSRPLREKEKALIASVPLP